MIRYSPILLAFAVVAANLSPPEAAVAQPDNCYITAAGTGFTGAQGVLVDGVCRPSGSGSTVPAPPTKTIFCGRPSSAANALWNRQCGPPRACVATDKQTGQQLTNDAFATLTLINGRWTNPVVWCPADNQPAINLTALRAQAHRLLPTVAIGSAWTDTALVNAETILWAATTPSRTLPAVTLLGRRVQLRIAFDHAHWDYGDGTHQTSASPGTAYDPDRDPCHTAQCPDYTGHTYQHTGRITITLQVSWHAQYSLTGRAWTDIAGTITGPTTRHVLTVKQARGVLIPNPGDH